MVEAPATQGSDFSAEAGSSECQSGLNRTDLGRDFPQQDDVCEIVLHIARLGRISGLERCKKLERLSLCSNFISRIEGLENCSNLITLELYQNQVPKIENVSHLVNLE